MDEKDLKELFPQFSLRKSIKRVQNSVSPHCFFLTESYLYIDEPYIFHFLLQHASAVLL